MVLQFGESRMIRQSPLPPPKSPPPNFPAIRQSIQPFNTPSGSIQQKSTRDLMVTEKSVLYGVCTFGVRFCKKLLYIYYVSSRQDLTLLQVVRYVASLYILASFIFRPKKRSRLNQYLTVRRVRIEFVLVVFVTM